LSTSFINNFSTIYQLTFFERWENEGFFGCKAVARALGQPNVPECAVAIDFLLFLCSKHSLSVWFSSLVHNGWGCGECGSASFDFVARRNRPKRAMKLRVYVISPHWLHPLLAHVFIC